MSGLAPFLIGLFSSVHCLAMCGGLCGVFCGRRSRWQDVALVNMGRIITYTVLGAVFAGLIQGLALRLPVAQWGFWLRTALGLTLIFMGLALLFRSRGWSMPLAESPLWRRLQKPSQRQLQKNSPYANVLKGLIWGLIPCGLLYGVLVAAATTGHWLKGAGFMFFFGLGTLPSMFVAAGLLHRWREVLTGPAWRAGAGIFIALIGLWTLAAPWVAGNLFPQQAVFTPIAAFLESCVP